MHIGGIIYFDACSLYKFSATLTGEEKKTSNTFSPFFKYFVTSNVYLKNIFDVSPIFLAFKRIVANVSTPWKINSTLGSFNKVSFTQKLLVYKTD